MPTSSAPVVPASTVQFSVSVSNLIKVSVQFRLQQLTSMEQVPGGASATAESLERAGSHCFENESPTVKLNSVALANSAYTLNAALSARPSVTPSSVKDRMTTFPSLPAKSSSNIIGHYAKPS